VTKETHIPLESDDPSLKLLVDFGLTPTEAIVYTATVRIAGGTTKEISVAAGKERAQTHHALSKLQQVGIVDATMDSPTRFRPVEIKEAIDHLYSLQSVKLRRLGEQRTELERALTTSISGAPIPPETYSIVKGRINTYLKMIESIHSAKKEVSLIMSAQGLTRLSRFRNFLKVVQAKSRKGVNFRIITEIMPENLEWAKSIAKYSELRHVKNQITNASIYDGKIASVALSISEDLNIDAGDHIALWTSPLSFARTLDNFFDSIWFMAAPAQPTIKSIETKAV
jgi:sugar-specific transcriptional regulator TrmB